IKTLKGLYMNIELKELKVLGDK
ncbi:MAG: hypothetical protein CI948_2052, partial [Halanaerobium sp.]